ncbi:MAG TPA: MBL fold metallo-hydrolase [Chthoniobacteraceae bacterium]|jgi:phosphoribosyl 1,2-cyclic phosphate phosphodiesterase|nr:MBL fold metallo-hydrolase [Chthoniobacteraceae bacterium]
MMTITFLGTGTSQGVPMIGCDCEVCGSADPRDKRTRSSIHVATPECAWVIDTGPEFRIQCLREKIDRVDAVVYTHSHTDHMMGFDDLRPFCVNGRDLPIYASAETMADLMRAFHFAFRVERNIPGYVRPHPHMIAGPFELGRTLLTPLPLKHGRAIVNGYLFERGGRKLAAYLSDCKEAPPAVIERIAGVERLIIDALRYKEHPTHFSVGEALAVAAQVGPRETWFTHICHDLGHAKTEAELPAGVRIAYDGLKLEFS